MLSMAEEKIGYRDILSQRQYMKIIVANVISRFGDSIDALAFTWLVYAVTQSAAWSGIIFALNQLPTILLQPFAGVSVENMNKKRVMVITDLIRGSLVVLLAVCYVTNHINPLLLAVFTLATSSVEAFCLPASTALIPKIIEKKYYAFATSLNSSASNVAQLVGVGAAGMIISIGGVGAAMLIDGLTFFCSAFIRVLIKVQEKKQEKKKANVNGYFEELKGGFQYIKSAKVVFNICVIAVFINAMFVPLNSLQSPMAAEIFGMGSDLLSVFGMAMFIGMAIGTAILPYVLRKLSVRQVLITSGILIGAAYSGILLGKYTYGQRFASYLLCGGITLVIGTAAAAIMGIVNIQFMKNVEEKYLARAASIFNASACAATPITSFLVSGLALKLPVSTIFLIAAAGYVITFLVVGIKKVQVE